MTPVFGGEFGVEFLNRKEGHTMQRRSRSPSLVVMFLVGCTLIGAPGFSGELQGRETQEPNQVARHSQASTPSGVTVQASFFSDRVAEQSCREGKRILGTSPSFIARGSIKVLADGCQDCCAENRIFADGFESNSTSNWSNTVGG